MNAEIKYNKTNLNKNQSNRHYFVTTISITNLAYTVQTHRTGIGTT